MLNVCRRQTFDGRRVKIISFLSRARDGETVKNAISSYDRSGIKGRGTLFPMRIKYSQNQPRVTFCGSRMNLRSDVRAILIDGAEVEFIKPRVFFFSLSLLLLFFSFNLTVVYITKKKLKKYIVR